MIMNDFFEPVTPRQKTIKWVTVLLIVFIGTGIFLLNLDDVIAYEELVKNPVYVQATISVEQEGFLIVSYPMYLSYSYAGKTYEKVPYKANQNKLNLRDDGKSLTVAINPDDPTQLASKMVNRFLFDASLLIIVIGYALLFYGIAIEIEPFRNWRSKKTKGKDCIMENPDYAKDVFLISLVMILSLTLALALCFPNIYGLADILDSL